MSFLSYLNKTKNIPNHGDNNDTDDKNINTSIPKVITRNGTIENMNRKEVENRLKRLATDIKPPLFIDIQRILSKVTKNIINMMTTTEIDNYAAIAAEELSIFNRDYSILATRILISSLHKNTRQSFRDKIDEAYHNTMLHRKRVLKIPLVSKSFYEFVNTYHERLQSMIDYSKDYNYTYFGIRTYLNQYCLCTGARSYSSTKDKEKATRHGDRKYIERIQDTHMRLAVSMHMPENYYEYMEISEQELNIIFEKIKERYDALSDKYYCHGSPAYFNAGSDRPQYASCFLLGVNDDSNSLLDCNKSIGLVSKYTGGIGVHCDEIRGCDEPIIGAGGGPSRGTIPFIQMFQATLKAWNQGGKRDGSGAFYQKMHHPDILRHISLRREDGTENDRARHIFPALWIPDIFMKRVEEIVMKEAESEENIGYDLLWSTFDPSTPEGKHLNNLYDDFTTGETKYTDAYLKYEAEELYVSQISVREIVRAIYEANYETGTPYLCNSDTVNSLSAYKNIGVINSSNLCAEIYEYSDNNEHAVCTLACISLPEFVMDKVTDEHGNISLVKSEFPENPVFDFNKLIEIVGIVVEGLDRIIDITYYPTEETKKSNMRHRPMGLGVAGLADTYCKMRLPFISESARTLNRHIMETIDYASICKSNNMCYEEYKRLKRELRKNISNSPNDEGHIVYRGYDGYTGKPIEYEFTDVESIPKNIHAYPSMTINGGAPITKGKFHWELFGLKESDLSQRYEWDTTREKCMIYGVRNKVRCSGQPTASTSQFLGVNEASEPYSSNVYRRKTKAGDFYTINKYLFNDLNKLCLWDDEMKDYLIATQGSIQHIDGIPDELKRLYLISTEIDTFELIRQSVQTQPHIDQGRSLNWYVSDMTESDFIKYMLIAWKGRLKTSKYYLHSTALNTTQSFAIDPTVREEIMNKIEGYTHISYNYSDVGDEDDNENIQKICLSCVN